MVLLVLGMRIGQEPDINQKKSLSARMKTFFLKITNQNLDQDSLMLFPASKTAPQCKLLATLLA